MLHHRMIIAGAIIGALARLIHAGRAEHLGAVDHRAGRRGRAHRKHGCRILRRRSDAGIDWIRWALSIIAAIVAISIYLSVTGRK